MRDQTDSRTLPLIPEAAPALIKAYVSYDFTRYGHVCRGGCSMAEWPRVRRSLRSVRNARVEGPLA